MISRVQSRCSPWMALAVALLPAGHAAGQRLPATFDHEEAALGARIEFPSLVGDASATVRCAARVSPSGKMEDNGCYAIEPGDQAFVPQINQAAKKARLNPASFDGRKREVYVQYRVAFAKKGDVETITIYNNPGLVENIEAYGEDHIAAQRGITDESWQKVCPKRTRYLVWAKAHVAASGEQSSISLVPGEGVPLTRECRDAIIATLEQSQFTPAFADGEPVPSSFIEPFGN